MDSLIPEGVLAVVAGVFGLILGSFGTVLSYRVPLGESIMGRSHCPSCGHMVTWVENFPVFSWVLLRGKCRHCGNRISPRYPVTELLTGVLFALAALKFGFTLETLAYGLFFWLLVVLTVIDFEHHKLPDALVFPLIAGGVLLLVAAAAVDGRFGRWSPLAWVASAVVLLEIFLVFDFKRLFSKREETPEPDPRVRWEGLIFVAVWAGLLVWSAIEGTTTSLSGAAVGAALFSGLFFGIVYIKPAGMGAGDIKLAIALGVFCGFLGAPKIVIVAAFLAFLIGGVLSGVLMMLGKAGRKTALPFGPFLALGTTVAIFVGNDIADAYLGTF
ncbi:MAG: prepilin peptidase [Actinomycetota bacterium]|nr:prepilin peptidase [Actinomycetota bacterium]